MENARIFKNDNIELVYDFTENILFWIDESKPIEFKVIQEDEMKDFTHKLFNYFKYDYYRAVNIYDDVKKCAWLGEKMYEAKKNARKI